MQPASIRLGIRENLPQFSLLVLINAFVGAMVGLERSILPLIAEQEFQIASKSVILSFIISFGIIKALSNLMAGRYSDLFGRKKLLVLGWLLGFPVPLLLIWAPNWEWIVAANILLGINQGLCWSTTVIMKSDLAGVQQRGLAMGLNEFAGYVAVAVAAYASASLANSYGLRPAPLYLGIGFAAAGLIFSLFVKETSEYAKQEAFEKELYKGENTASFGEVFALTSWRNKNLFSCSQAGLVNNLNDGIVWGLFPIFFVSVGYGIENVGFLTALYPGVWGILQPATGFLSDTVGRKRVIVGGMWIQAIAIVCVVLIPTWEFHLAEMALLGVGTAMVYPTLLAAAGDNSSPGWRASALGVYRFWRDMGYAFGGLLAGVIADIMGINYAILFVGVLTFGSGTLSAIVMKNQSKT